jgi:hypothetical protein
MATEQKKMKSIWYLVGIMLLAMGVLILGSGIYYLFVPSTRQTVLADLHPSIWWGAVILVAGLIFTITHRNSTADH